MSTVFIDDGFPFLYCRHASCPAAILRRAPTSFVRAAASASAADAGLLTARPHLCLSSSDQLASSTTSPLHYSYYRAAAAAAAAMMPSIYPPAALKLETSVGQIGNPKP
jgi:hypothetical protein